MKKTILRTLLIAACALAANSAMADRIKDYAKFEGVRDNQLVGYGLVVGLDGTGDQTAKTPFAIQSTMSMLQKLGVTLPPNSQMQLKNIATVIVTGSLPPFAKIGQQLDVTVSSMGNAKSLRGGMLIATPLKGLDGNTYAIAQGNVIVSGAGAESGNNKTVINHLNAGRIPSGASVERMLESTIGEDGEVRLELNNADFQMVSKVVDSVNQVFPGKARAVDARAALIKVPQDSTQKIAFLGQIENLPLGGPVHAAKVTINARTGSIAMNQSVTITEVAVAHGSLMVQITDEPVVSQPAPLSNGQTVKADQRKIDIKQQPGQFVRLQAGSNLMDVVRAINNTGATPSDLISVLQAMKNAGALRAEIEVI